MNQSEQFEIVVTNEQSSLAIDSEQMREAVALVLREASIAEATVSVAVVDDPTIHELNRKYLQHDYPTDVLSFTLSGPGEPLEGEIVVSTETAIARATDYGWPAANELLLYIVHGALHLVGYEDKSPEACREMRAAERRMLAQWNIVPPEVEATSNEVTEKGVPITTRREQRAT